MLRSLTLRTFVALAMTTAALGACSDDGVSSEPEPSSFVIVSGNPQTVTTGATAQPLVVRVLDQDLVPMEGVTVSWALTSTVTGSLVSNSSMTNAEGEASNTVNAGLTAGTLSITATVEGLPAKQFTVTITAAQNPDPQALRGN